MDGLQLIQAVGDLSSNALLVLVLWQGLKRFDRLLDLVITLAARTPLTAEEVEKLRKTE